MTSNTIVQYVVVREDLLKTLKWPVGALIAQACHACTSVIHKYYTDEHTQRYLADLDRMHKIILKAPDEKSLKNLEESLNLNHIDMKMWIEQPEDIATCIATKPYPRDEIKNYFKDFKLFK